MADEGSCPCSPHESARAFAPHRTSLLRCRFAHSRAFREGGKGASTSPVPRPEQHRQGGTMSEFYRNNNVGHNDQFRVGISPPP
ncbi:NucA/NucB deoxyribonuclease domain-containing protein [Bradyrhizobium sp.]|uniref:NucA/NucB deoxyribonuclease domain-containing protein n=1 Tax=Bradyrhizobium sp. TaxID=376 RepID=UPI003C6F0EEC